MNTKISFLIIAALLLSSCATNTINRKDTTIADKVGNLLSQMTLEEKIGQMAQLDFSVIGNKNHDFPIDKVKLDDAIIKHHIGSIVNPPAIAQPVTTWQKIMQAIQASAANSRLKIPVIYGIDAVHGATFTKGATLFPQAINMAATFNPELSRKEGEITARELKASGFSWGFAPVMDIGRQPLWSRLWETYGEDLHLVNVLGTAYINGHQGTDFSAPDKAATCLKHFIGYSFPLNGKDRTAIWMGERMLREYFLPPFEAGINAGSPAIMVNSAEVDGIPGHANHQYLTTILRGELGFKGVVVSDWEDIYRLYTHHKLAASPREAVKIAIMAGVDMSMVPLDFSFNELLLDLVKSNEVPLARIDEAVTRILTMKYQAGLFKPDSSSAKNQFATADAQQVNQQAAHESIVLAKNSNAILPLKKSASILVTGPTANLLSTMNGGWTITWGGDVESAYPHDKATVLKALQQRTTGKITYVEGSSFDSEKNINQVVAEAKNHDYILLCLGEKTYAEMLGNIDSLALEAAQIKLANAAIATGKPVILLMLGGRPRIITPIADRATGVLLGFLPGMEGGDAIADILYGDYNPNGKLPISYPKDTNSITPYDHKPAETYTPLYPFAHGLSYTTFETSGLTLEKHSISKSENLNVSVQVKNTGTVKGKEIVLLYLNDVAASVTRPNKQLKAFKKVELNPDQSETVTFTLTPRDLSFIGIDLQRTAGLGEFKVMVGNESAVFSVDQ